MNLIIIRPATEADEPDILKLLDTYMREDYFMSTGHLHRVITGIGIDGRYREPCKTYVAIYEEQIVGFGVVTPHADTLVNLFIHPDYRQQGLGKEMIKLLQPSRIRVKRNMADGDPLVFYEKLGYYKESDVEEGHITVLENETVLQPSLFSKAKTEQKGKPENE